MNKNDETTTVAEEISGMLAPKAMEEEEQTDDTVSNDETPEGEETKDESSNEKETSEDNSAEDAGDADGENDEGEEEAEDGETGEAEEEGAEGEDNSAEESTAVEAIQAQMAKMQETLDAVLEAKDAAEEPEPEPEPETLVLPEGDFISTEDFSPGFFDDAVGLNKALTRVSQTSSTAAVEHVLKVIPTIVSRMVAAEVNLHRAADKFYEKNPDLKANEKFVKHVYEDLLKKSPKDNPFKVLDGLAKEVRKQLGKAKPSGDAGKNKHHRNRNKFAPSGGSARKAKLKAPTGIASEIKELEELG